VRVEYLAWDLAEPRNVARAFLAIMDDVAPGNAKAGPEENSGPASE